MIKSYLSKIFAAIVRKRIDRWAKNPVATQQKVFEQLISQAKNTAFGRDHHFDEIKNYDDFVARVPIRDYEALRPYIERVVEGEPNVLWKGKPAGQSTYLLPKPLCLSTYRQPAMPYSAIYTKLKKQLL